ncbi:hypothetical protein L1987_08800 [Smallanthus sonchifolius]|uniref:Uncharacterized protein n=1 Tax=Smallanthus sonchifolius TaxID=185202 RepID=A0ACB9JNJ9_9ASTR|nr:hypothetical protein L1987_08800 [Smallanthus sonchifolius]
MSKAYRVYNKRTKIIEESVNVKFFEASSLKPIIGPDALFYLDSFQQTFSHADVGAEGNLFPIKEKEKDIDYRVSFRRPSIDPPFVAKSSLVAEGNDVAHNSVSNFDTRYREKYSYR